MRNFDLKNMIGTPIDHKEKQCGIYCIRNKLNRKFYIGSSVNCYHRIKSQHLYKLRRNIHTNPHLQSSWNKHGEDIFEYFVVEECQENKLIELEQLYLDNTAALSDGYNINQTAGVVVLTEEQKKKISISKRGKPRSAQTKKKISEANKQRKWSDEQRMKFIKSNTGKVRSDESKSRMSKAQKKAWETRPREWSDHARKAIMAGRMKSKENV